MTLLKKLVAMAILGAIGATLGAGMGEMLFIGDGSPRTESRKICLLFDISGSMGDRISREGGRSVSQLSALQDAASDFLRRQDLSIDPVGLAVFSSDAHVVNALTHDAGVLNKSIARLYANGGTNLGRGFDVAASVLKDQTGERWILVFTDGKPETSSVPGETPERAALNAAARARNAGIQIVAIGTGLADAGLLAQAAGSTDNVIVSDPRKLHDAFRQSEAVINRQMLASTASSRGFQADMMLAGAWVALVAIFAGMGLVIGQNRHLRRRPISPRQMAAVFVGGIVTGVAAGAASQSLFYALSGAGEIVALGRVASWTVLGCGVGFGIGSVVPNLPRHRATVAGAIGGIFAAFCFLTLVPAVGDTIGRLLAAAILGISTGLMMVLVEAASRTAYLLVHWSASETSSLTLGAKPILVGSSPEAHVLLPEGDDCSPIVARISMVEGVPHLTERNGATRALSNGEVLTYGRVRLEVCGKGTRSAANSGHTPPSPRTIPEKPKTASASKSKSKAKWYSGA